MLRASIESIVSSPLFGIAYKQPVLLTSVPEGLVVKLSIIMVQFGTFCRERESNM